MRRIAALALAPVVALPLAVVPMAGVTAVSASPAPAPTPAPEQTRLDRVFLDITSRTVIDVGATGSSVGDVTITEGTISTGAGGARIGGFTTRVVVVVPGESRERRDTYVQLRLPGGTLLVRQLNEDPTGKPPSSPHVMPIVGGSGPYFAARGAATTTPIGNGRLRLDISYLPITSMSSFETNQYRRVVTHTIPGTVGSTGDVEVSGLAARGFLSIDGERHPFTCGQTSGDVQGVGAPTIWSWVCRYAMPGGSLLTMSLGSRAGGSAPPQFVTQAVIGGTGEYIGARGTISMVKPEWTSSGRVSVTLATGRRDYRSWRPTWSRERTGRWVLPLGERRVGELVLAEGELAGQGASPSIGYTVRTGANGDRRMSQFAFSVDGDTLYATAMFSTSTGQPPSTPYLALVNGGTGAYMGATGILRVVPTGATTADISGNLLVSSLTFG